MVTLDAETAPETLAAPPAATPTALVALIDDPALAVKFPV
jgi:hypothetical protein